MYRLALVLIPFFLLFSSPWAAALDSGEEREKLLAIFRDEGIAYEERMVELDEENSSKVLWVMIPGSSDTESEDNPSFLSQDIPAELEEINIPFELPEESFILVIPLRGAGGLGAPDGIRRIIEAPDPGSPLVNDLSWGTETGLNFIREALERNIGRNIVVIFLEENSIQERTQAAPENGDSGEALVQNTPFPVLQDIYSSLYDPENSIVVFLDFPAPPGALRLYHGSYNSLAPLDLVRPITEILFQEEISYTFENRYNALYKLGLSQGPSFLGFFQSRNVPSLLISSGRGSTEAGKSLSSPTLGKILTDFAERAQVEIGNQDAHYSIYYYRNRTVFFSEYNTIRLLLLINGIVTAGILLIFLTRRIRMIFLFRTGFSYSWVSVLYFLALFVSILASGGFLSALSALFRLPLDTLSRKDFLFCVSFSILIGITLFFLLPAYFLTAIKIPKRGGFYGFTAIFFSILFFLFGIYIDITTSDFLAWNLIWLLLGMIWQNPVPAFLFTLLLTLRPGIVLYSALQESGFTDALIRAGIATTLALTLLLLPFLLSLMRGMALTFPYRLRKKITFHFIRFSVFILLVITLILYMYRISIIR
ncbi:MAG: hypothetical protein LBT16_00555 [Treponema sp.]|jgi:hypothetical protein|nr:hypothetical protein [Treponema sp.]